MSNNLLNIFTDKLYNYKNKTYLQIIKNTIDENNLEEIEIEFLEKSINLVSSNELFLINKKGEIEFLNKFNLIKFKTKEKKYSINNLLNINIKNEKTYEVIKTIAKLQKSFIKTNNLKKLKYITHEEILEEHKKIFGTYLEKSIISIVLNNTYYKDSQNKSFMLKYLTPRKSFIIFVRIKAILSRSPLASDKEIQSELLSRFDIELSTVHIAQVRKKYFIPKKSNRVKKAPYIRFREYFSYKTVLSKHTIRRCKNKTGIYELSIKAQIEYSFDYSNIIYVGSSKNIYKRFIEYISDNAHTKEMREFFKKNKIIFRYIETDNHLELEKTLLDEFVEKYGSLPLLNKNKLFNESRFDLD